MSKWFEKFVSRKKVQERVRRNFLDIATNPSHRPNLLPLPLGGIAIEGACRRGIDGCTALKSIASSDGSGFVCCGEVEESARAIERDKFRLCWRTPAVDEMGDYDVQDIAHTIMVLSVALAIHESEAS